MTRYEYAKNLYAKIGIDTDKAIENVAEPDKKVDTSNNLTNNNNEMLNSDNAINQPINEEFNQAHLDKLRSNPHSDLYLKEENQIQAK